MPHKFTIHACALSLLAALSFTAPQTAAAKRKGSEATMQKKSTKAKQPRSSSEESTAERDRRLYRECKGRPNAGACLGYARP